MPRAEGRNGLGHRFGLVAEAEIRKLDTSFAEPMYQVVAGGKRLQINDTGRALLEYLRIPRSDAELEQFLSDSSHAVGKDNMNRFLDICLKAGIVADNPDSATATYRNAEKQRRKKNPLLVSVSLLSQKTLYPLTQPLSRLFALPAVVACLILIVVSYSFAIRNYAAIATHIQATLQAASTTDWILLILINVGALFFHELGHSSACARYGCTHGNLGAGLYFIYPVFFADVSDTWTLPRMQRVIVDSAGIYFHLVFGSVCYLLWLTFHAPIFILTVYSILTAVVLNLNPFLRFDGYWIFSDLLGIPNLYHSVKDLCGFIWRIIRRRTQGHRPPIVLSTRPIIQLAVVLYATALMMFTVYFGYQIIYRLVPTLVTTVPSLAKHMLSLIEQQRFGAEFWATLLKALLLGTSVWGLILMAFRGLSYLGRQVTSSFSWYRRRRVDVSAGEMSTGPAR